MKEVTTGSSVDGHENEVWSPWKKPRGTANLQSSEQSCRQAVTNLGCILEQCNKPKYCSILIGSYLWFMMQCICSWSVIDHRWCQHNLTSSVIFYRTDPWQCGIHSIANWKMGRSATYTGVLPLSGLAQNLVTTLPVTYWVANYCCPD